MTGLSPVRACRAALRHVAELHYALLPRIAAAAQWERDHHDRLQLMGGDPDQLRAIVVELRAAIAQAGELLCVTSPRVSQRTRETARAPVR